MISAVKTSSTVAGSGMLTTKVASLAFNAALGGRSGALNVVPLTTKGLM